MIHDSIGRLFKQLSNNYNRPIQFYNWGFSEVWFTEFIKNCGLMDSTQAKFCFCSVFGNRKILKFIPSDSIIFYTGENVRNPFYQKYAYADGLLNYPGCALSLGFDFFDNDRYLRFPLWILYEFEPVLNSQTIKKRCQELRYPQSSMNREHFACLIAHHDSSGLRTEMYNKLVKLGRIDCPSRLLHNDDTLAREFGDNKKEYLKRYLFNICPENSNAYGYVTEKLFEAISSACIPIYWGSNNTPERGIINPEAIVFWNTKDSGESAYSQVDALIHDKQYLQDFLAQPRLLPDAEEKIEEMMVLLKEKLQNICTPH